MTVRRRAPWAIAVLTALALAGCGQDGGISLPTGSDGIQLPSPTRTDALPSPTRTLAPTRTQTTPTEEPTSEGPTSEAPTEEPTSEAPTEEPTTEAPTEEPTSQAPTTEAPTEEPTTEAPTTEAPTEEPTTEAPTESESPTSQTPTESPSATAESGPASASASAVAAGDSTSSGLPLWLGLGALLAALAGLAWFLVAGSRRRKWDERLEVERTQARWVADQLVPSLTDPTASADQVAQNWGTAQPTLDQLDANLVELATDAPDDGRALVCRSIAGAVTQVRSSAAAHVALMTSGTASGQALGASAAALVTARNQLSTAIGPPHEQ